MKFDLSKLPAEKILDAKLDMKWDYVPGSSGFIQYFLYETSTAWNEGTITWNNAPKAETKVSPILSSGDVHLDLTNFFDSHRGISSLRTVNTYCDGNTGIWFSRESSHPINLTVTYRVPNTAPTIAGAENNNGVYVGENATFRVYWVDNEGDNATLYICKQDEICANDTGSQWCNTTATASPASCSYTTRQNDSTDNAYYAFVCDDYDGSCSTPVAGNFTVIHGPFVENVSVSPTTAYRNSNLTGSGDYGDIHGKPQANSTLIWLVNGAAVKNETDVTGSTLSYNFTVGDNVTFSFTPCNADGECGETKASSLTIENAKPVIEIAEHPSYYSNSDVELNASIYNLDNDPLVTAWQWRLNGNLTAANTSTFPKSYNYSRGDNITYYVNSTDGMDTTNATGTITIANYPPHISSHAITSPAYSGSNLSCSWVATDADDPLSNATAEWYRNGVLVPAWSSSTTCQNGTTCTAAVGVPSTNTSLGDNFTCRIRVTDGIDTSESNATVTIVPECGDGVIEGDEQCEGTDFGGKSCSSYGYSRGSLSCNSCRISKSGCSNGNGGSSSGGGGGSSGGGGGGGSTPLTTEDKGTTASGEKLEWPVVLDLGAATVTRDFGYTTKFITNDYTEIKTYITDKIEFGRSLQNVSYTVTIPKEFAKSASSITITGANYTVTNNDPTFLFRLGNVPPNGSITINYTVGRELLKYDIQSIVLAMQKPELDYSLPVVATPIPTPAPTATPAPIPTATPSPKPEKADITGLLAFSTGPFGWGILLFLLAVLLYVKRDTVIAAVPKVNVPPVRRPAFLKEKPKQVLKPVPKLPSYPTKFPSGDRRRSEVVAETAALIQHRDGKVHAAGIWHELHNHYGDSVVRDRIYIEKWIGDWLKQNAEYTGSYRNAKYYKLN